jgi:hypothetical protein
MNKQINRKRKGFSIPRIWRIVKEKREEGMV